MDDFIDDDIGDQEDILTQGQHEEGGFQTGVCEAQLMEASQIFWMDYLEFMGGDVAEEDEDDDEIMGQKYQERGIRVNLGVYSEKDELIS